MKLIFTLYQKAVLPLVVLISMFFGGCLGFNIGNLGYSKRIDISSPITRISKEGLDSLVLKTNDGGDVIFLGEDNKYFPIEDLKQQEYNNIKQRAKADMEQVESRYQKKVEEVERLK